MLAFVLVRLRCDEKGHNTLGFHKAGYILAMSNEHLS
jgi:hypothetical protein